MVLLAQRDGVQMDATAAFLAALRCPGAAAHGIFNPLAFFELAKTLRALLVGGGSANSSLGSQVDLRKPAPSKTKGKRSSAAANTDADDDEAEDADDDGAAAISPSSTVLLEELSLLLQRVPLASQPEALVQLVSILASIGAYETLAHCCAPHHGEPGVTLPTVLRAVIPTLALADGGLASARSASTAATIASQRACEAFVATVVVQSVGAHFKGADDEGCRAGAALQASQALLQRVSAAAPDRAEPRYQVCTSLARLLVLLPSAAAARYASFLWKCARFAQTTRPLLKLFCR